MIKTTGKLLRFMLPVLLLSVAGCASSQQSGRKTTAPDWVTSAPAESPGSVFFIGSAADETGNTAGAEEAATYSLIAEITRFLGVRVTEETTSTAKASLDSFTADLTQVVRQSSTAQVSGFKVADRWVSRSGTRVMVYLLGEYARKDLLAEKERLAAIFREKQEAISRPEQEARMFEAEGNYFEALKKYFEAAGAAYRSDVDNAKVKFERNINGARNILSSLSVVALTDNLQNMTGVPFSDSLRAQVLYGERKQPVANASFEISYRETKNGRATMKNTTALSNEQGIVTFRPPVPTAVGNEKVTLRLDLSSYLQALSGVPDDLKSQLEALEDLTVDRRVVLSYSAISRARDITTGVLILDMDKAQNPMKNGETSAGVLQSLTAAGFKVVVLPMDPSLLKGMSDSQIIEMILRSNTAGIERLVFGLVGIDDFSQDGDNYLVRVSGNLKAAELQNGTILYSGQDFTRTVGRSSSSTISSAFRNLGKKFGEELAAKLP